MDGYGDPFTPGAFPLLQYVLRGIKRSPRPPPHTCPPITPSILKAMKSVWASRPSDGDHIMGFFGFMWAGEFTLKSARDFDPSTCLTPQDVVVDQHANPSMLRIHLKQSKTDPFRHGVDIYIHWTHRLLTLPSSISSCICCYSPGCTRAFLHFQRWVSPDKRQAGCGRKGSACRSRPRRVRLFWL